MLHALAHVPPAPPGPPLPHTAEEDDDLTPPPDLSPVKALTGRADSGDEAMTPTSSELETKRNEIEHEAAKEIAGELNGKRRRAKVSYKEAAPEGEEEEEEIETKSAKKARQTPTKKAVQEEYDPEGESEGDADVAEDDVPPVTPKKGGRKKATKVKAEDEDGEEEGTPAKEKKVKKPTPKKSRLAILNDEPDLDEDGNEIVKKKRKVKVYPKIEYDIPDVPKKTTNFKGECQDRKCLSILTDDLGRLGYACLNTVLRSQKPDSVFCSRTCRIASIEEEGMELPKTLALMNVKDLLTMIEVCAIYAIGSRLTRSGMNRTSMLLREICADIQYPLPTTVIGDVSLCVPR
jgi:UV DNA damage endonuclease